MQFALPLRHKLGDAELKDHIRTYVAKKKPYYVNGNSLELLSQKLSKLLISKKKKQ